MKTTCIYSTAAAVSGRHFMGRIAAAYRAAHGEEPKWNSVFTPADAVSTAGLPASRGVILLCDMRLLAAVALAAAAAANANAGDDRFRRKRAAVIESMARWCARSDEVTTDDLRKAKMGAWSVALMTGSDADISLEFAAQAAFGAARKEENYAFGGVVGAIRCAEKCSDFSLDAAMTAVYGRKLPLVANRSA